MQMSVSTVGVTLEQRHGMFTLWTTAQHAADGGILGSAGNLT
jgi:hypothetical protein